MNTICPPRLAFKQLNKFAAAFLTFFIFIYQTATPVFAEVYQQQVQQDNYVQSLKNANENEGQHSSEQDFSEKTSNFFGEEFSLRDLDNTDLDQATTKKLYDVWNGKQGFNYAVEEITEDYAAANILDGAPTERQLRAAAEQNVEHALLVVDGEIVFLTTGREGEILLNSAANELLQRAAKEDRVAVVVHNHPQGQNIQPSLFDIQTAKALGANILNFTYGIDEYGFAQAYSYDGSGNVNEVTLSEISNQLTKHHSPDSSSKETRNLLSDFIAAVDDYNVDKNDAVKFLSANATVLPGFPVLNFFNGGGAGQESNWANQPQSSSEFRFDFNVAAGGFQGAVINFAGSEGPQNLSGFSNINFRMNTNSCGGCTTSLKIEVKDSSGGFFSKVVILNATEQDVTLTKSELDPSLDLTKITEIVFVGEKQPTHSGVGYIDIKTGGLNYEATNAPDPSKGTNDVTPLPKKSDGEDLTVTPFASSGSTATINQTSGQDVEITFNGNNANAFGGVFWNYDDPTTSSQAESINLNSLFPNGIVLEADNAGTGVSEFKFEVTDATGNTDSVTLTGVTASKQRWVVKAADLERIDTTKAVIFSIVRVGAGNGQKINLKLGNFSYLPTLQPDPTKTEADITALPRLSDGAKPTWNAFASSDGSNASVDQLTQSFAKLTYNGNNASSFGGVFTSFDNPATGSTIESINFSSLYPGGFIFQMDSAGKAIESVRFEVTDTTGKTDFVILENIEAFGQRWVVKPSDFQNIDLSKIAVMAIVALGAETNSALTINVGDFQFTPQLPPDASKTEADITSLPKNSLGQKPFWTSFASGGSTASVTQESSRFARLNYNGANSDAFAGVFTNYDNPATSGVIESINLTTQFPSGIVLQLDSPGAAITEAFLEVTDINGNTDTVILKDVKGFGQRWFIDTAQFDDVDPTKIAIIAMVVKGQESNADLVIAWDGLAFDAALPPDPTKNESDITPLPLKSTGARVEVVPFASAGSSASIDVVSETFATVTYTGAASDAFGGVFMSYDDTTTTAVESIDLSTLFPAGLILQLDSSQGGLDQIAIEVTDANDNRDTVFLKDIKNFGQRWVIDPAQFDEVDITKISVISTLIFGQKTDAKLSINWGLWDVEKRVGPDATKTEADITRLPLLANNERPLINAFAKNEAGTNANVNVLSASFAQVTYDGANADSFGGAFINFDLGDGAPRESINFDTAFPGGLILAMDSGSTTEVALELTDINGNKDTVKLSDIKNFGQRWLIQKDAFFGLDFSKITTLSFVFTGADPQSLNLNWGNWAATKQLVPDATKTNADITKLPLLANGQRPTFNGFAKNEAGTTSAVNVESPSSATISYDGANAESFGGGFLTFDLDNGAPAETIDFTALYPGGLVIGADSTNATEVIVEITDVNGSKDSVKLVNLSGTTQRWVVRDGDFFGLDLTKVQTISFVFTGDAPQNLKVTWGDWDFTGGINPDPTKTNADITKLPALANGDRPNLNGFAKTEAGTSSTVNLASSSVASISYDGNDADSFGGAFVTYDLDDGAPKETINFDTVYPNGLVLALSSPDATSVTVEFTDINGNKDSVILNGITASEQRWVIPNANLFGVDMTKLLTISLVFTGADAKNLNLNLGDWDFTKTFNPDPTKTVADITKLPLLANGERPFINPFSKTEANTTATVNVGSESFASVFFFGDNADSFGGAFVSYDLDDGAPIETINFNTAFPAGLVLALDSVDSTAVALELTDINGNKDSVLINDLKTGKQLWTITGDGFFGIDLTQIVTMSFVFTGNGVDTVNIDLGDWDVTKQIGPDAALTDADITKLPLRADGTRVNVGAFNSVDGANNPTATITTNVISENFLSADVDATNGFAGLSFNYDLDSTAGTVETIDLQALTSGKFVLQLDSPASDKLDSLVLQLRDNTGKTDTVILSQIDTFGQRWGVDLATAFFGLDMTKISEVVLLVQGAKGKFNLQLGDWDVEKSIGPDASKTEADITKLPLLANGERPFINAFNKDEVGTSSTVTAVSESFATVNYDGADADSFGGAFISFDLDDGAPKESINFDTAFPAGLILQLDSADATSITLEIADADGNTDSVVLSDLKNFGQRWLIQKDAFFGIDFTKVTTFSFVFKGAAAQSLNLSWGDWDATKQIGPDGSLTDADITKLPLRADGTRVNVGAFNSVDGANNPTATITTNVISENFLSADVDATNGFAGLSFNYDLDSTAGTVETIDLQALTSGKFVLQLDSPASDKLNSLVLQLRDNTGKTDTVILSQIDTFGQRWGVDLATAFFGLDMTKISEVVLLVQGAKGKFNLQLGDWDVEKSIGPDASKTEADITKLPLLANGERPFINAFNKDEVGTSSTVTAVSESFATVNYDGADADSFGGAFISFDLDDGAPKESINFDTAFPAGLILQLDSADATSITLEIADADGNTDSVVLSDLKNFGQRWLIQKDAFFGIDFTKVTTFSFVFKGAAAQSLNLSWGDWDATKQIGPDGSLTEADITKLPLRADGTRVNVGAFNSVDGANNPTATITTNVISENFLSADVDATNGFAGLSFNYDLDSTAGTVETIDLQALTSGKFVLQLDSPASDKLDSLVLQLRDNTGKTDTVILSQIDTFGQRWGVDLATAFFGLDMTKISEVVLLVQGAKGKFNLQLGDWDVEKSIGPDASKTEADITKLPLLANGERPFINAFNKDEVGTSSTVTAVSESFATVNYDGADADSFGGAFISFDLDDGAPKESINFDTAFPAGLILQLDSADATSITLEIADADGNTDSVVLSDLKNFGQRWLIQKDAFFGIDFTKVTTFSFVFKGADPQSLNLSWGDWDATKQIGPDGSLTEADITKLPLRADGTRVNVGAFNSVDGANNPTATITTNVISENFLSADVDATNGFAGLSFNYDLDSTAGTVETIDLQALTSGKFVLQLDSPASDKLDSLVLQLRDNTGKTDTVILSQIDTFGQRWGVDLATAFFGLDMTKISEVVLLVQGAKGKFNLQLGDWDVEKSIGPDASKTEADITKLPLLANGERPFINAFNKDEVGTSSTVTAVSESFATVNYDGADADSFGGAFISFDLDDGAPKESINFDTAFPAGLILQLDSADATSITLEIADADGNTDSVVLSDLKNFGQRWLIQKDAFFGIDFTKVTTFSFVFKGAAAQSLNLSWGDWDATKQIGPDGSLTEADITKLPLRADGTRVNVGAFNSVDGANNPTATITTNVISENFLSADVDATNGFAGLSFNYDLDSTAGTVETIDLQALTSGKFVLQLDSPASDKLDSLVLQLRDNTGKTDTVILSQIDTFGQRWGVDLATAFFGLDMTKISEVVLLVQGAKGKFNLQLGDWDVEKSIGPDASKTDADITRLPLLANGDRPSLNAFAKNEAGTSSNVNVVSASFATVSYDGANADSFGGAFISFDLDDGDPKESINFDTEFPTGLILAMDSGDATGIALELADADGNVDSVLLSDIKNFGQRWLIQKDAFFGLDFSKITTLSFVFTGADPQSLNLNWGNWAATKQLVPDATKTNADITKLPLLANGQRPTFNGFAKNEAGTTSAVNVESPSSATISYDGANAESFGGGFLTFDLDNGAPAETIDFTALYPGGLVIGADSTNATEVIVEITDVNGSKDSVKLVNLSGTTQRWVVRDGDFFGLDLTKVQTISFVFTGDAPQNLKVTWGDWDFTGGINPDPTKTNADITKLPALANGDRPNLNGFAKTEAGTSSTVNLASSSVASISYDGNDADSFGGAFVTYDLDDGAPKETINFDTVYPNGLVLALSSPDATSVTVEFTDINGNKDSVILNGITASEQRWVIPNVNLFGVDMTKLLTISLVFTGADAKNLNLNLGDWDFTKTFNPDPTKTVADITKLPLLANGERPFINPFSKTEANTTATVNVGSESFASVFFFGDNADSFGGAFVSYDLDDGAPIETINFNTAFPAGLVLALDSVDSTAVALELTDINGNKDSVLINDLKTGKQLWTITGDGFFGIDLTQIVTMSFVFTGNGVDTVNIDLGDWDVTKQIGPDAALTDADITKLPLRADGTRVNVGAFNSVDGANNPTATITTNVISENFLSADVDATNGFAGLSFNYDLDSTAGTVETIDLQALTSGKFVLQLDSPASDKLDSLVLQLRDNTGKTDTVILSQIDTFGQRWGVDLATAFFGLDMTKISEVVLLVQGAKGKFNLQLGDWDVEKSIGPDASKTEADITKLPLLANGERPFINAFNKDEVGTSSTVTAVSESFATVNYDGADADSFGGAFISFDLDDGAPKESINFDTAFPAGLILQLDSADATSITLEIADADGNTDSVVLSDLKNFGQRWLIQKDAFFGIDFTKVTTFSFVFKGAAAQSLNLSWGDWDATKQIGPDGSLTDADITKLPLRADGTRVNVGAFNSVDGANNPTATITTNVISENFLSADVDATNGFAGLSFNYDLDSTAGTVETIDLQALTSGKFVLQLDSPASDKLNSLVLQLRDNTGKTDTVILSQIDTFGQRWGVDLATAFFGLDMTKISEVVLLVQGAKGKFNLQLGDWDVEKSIGPDASKTEADITKLPLLANGERPSLNSFAKNEAGTNANVSIVSETFATVSYAGTDADSFGGAFISFDLNDGDPKETINFDTTFPAGLILQLDSADATGVTLEIADADGNTDSVVLSDLKNFGQRWLIQKDAFFGVDFTKILTVSFVFKGADPRTLNVNWGNWDATKIISPDASKTPADITRLPLMANGQAPSLNAFAKLENGTTSTIDMSSPTFAGIKYKGDNDNSFGGGFVSFDLDDGDPKESIDFNAIFPAGLILQLDSPDALNVVFELTDVNGNKDTVLLSDIKTFGQRWLIENTAFFGVDLSKITTFSFVFTGKGEASVNLDWGNFAFTPLVSGETFDATKLHQFTEIPDVNELGSNTDPRKIPGFITLNLVNKEEFNFTYDLVGSKTAFTVASLTKGFFDAGGNFIGQRLNLPESFVIALKGDDAVGVPRKTRVNITDENGNVAVFELLVTNQLQNFTMDLTNPVFVPAGFDRTKVATVEIVLDRNLAGDSAQRGRLDVRTGGTLNFIGNITGNPFNAATLHNFTEVPEVNASGLNTNPSRIPGFVTLNVRSAQEFDYVYDLVGSSTAFVVTSISKGFFNTAGFFQGSAMSLPEMFEIAIQGDSTVGVPNLIRMQITDTNGKRAFYDLAITGSLQNFTIDLSDPSTLPSGFDRASIAAIDFVVDRALVGNSAHRGKVKIQVAGTLNYIPVVTGSTFNNGNLHVFTEGPEVTSTGANTDPAKLPGFVTLDVLSNKEFNVTYDLVGSATAFVFTSISKGFFDGSNVFQGTALQLPSILEMAFQGDPTVGVPNTIRIEITDTTGKVAKFDAKVTDQMQNFAFDLSNPNNIPTGFNINSIASVQLIQDRKLVGPSARKGKFKVRIGGNLDVTPEVSGTAFDASALTNHTNSPNVNSTGGNTSATSLPGSITMNQFSNEEFEYAYSLEASDTAFVFTTISNGFFDGTGTFQGTAGSLPENFVLAAKGSTDAKMKVEITDVNGKIADFILDLEPAYQNFTINLAGNNIPSGFDRNQIAQITLIEDRALAPTPATDLVQIMTKGLNYTPPASLPQELLDTRDELIAKGQSFFTVGNGIDPVTHFPYDAINSDGTLEDNSKFTQPTLIGFYLQMLGDAALGKADFNGMTKTQLLAEMEIVVDNLLDAQTRFGWNGLLPFLDLEPYGPITDVVGIGDNANLAQSLAVVMGALESAGLTGADLTKANAIIADMDVFLDNQEAGYVASVHPTFGLLQNAVNSTTGAFTSFLDRFGDEFRGAIAFLKVRYPSLPDTIWDNLSSSIRSYKTGSGDEIMNLAAFDGSAFQIFWPLLRNDELDHLGTAAALYNQFVAHADFAAEYNIPGFLSAAETPDDHEYVGDMGIREIAEWPFSNPSNGLLLMDTGSSYAIASGYRIAPEAALKWLHAIAQIEGMNGTFGLLDSARSGTEIAKRWLGIDLASTVLGLTGVGGEAFDTYLHNRNLALDFGKLYDQKDNLGIIKSNLEIIDPTEFPDRSFAVLRNTEFLGSINSFQLDNHDKSQIRAGAYFDFDALPGGFGGVEFLMDEVYDATANQLVLQYSVQDNPGDLKIEIKNETDQIIFSKVILLSDQSNAREVQKLVIDLPNLTSLGNVKKVGVIIDQNLSGDNKGEFLIHSMNFQHLASSQEIAPNASLATGDVTTLPNSPEGQLFSSSVNSTLDRISARLSKLNFDVTANGFAGMSINFDPASTGASADLSALTKLVFGLDSDKAKRTKIEIQDDAGNQAVFYATDIDTTRQYYELLTSMLIGSVDLTKVKKINFVVDQNSVTSGNEVGFMNIEFDGLLFP